ncbi:hypothetical protein H5V45_09230 [Nocardioides sp. KIGAM211]|uniref:Uncharacterized protein n=1 Tax=Nocardioides luti TaxID=2761101 RepID=A0A7X0RFT8_9ACTN|nr:hypothetical protein [Nocardioides luti]MBB6627504.1 hypothetical protein [Nocardioides luti]
MRFFRRREAQPELLVTIRAGLAIPDLTQPVEMTGTTTAGVDALVKLFAS